MLACFTESQDLCRQRMRQNESKETAAADPIAKCRSSDKLADQSASTCGNSSATVNSSGSAKDSLSRAGSVQEEEPLVSAALNMDISTGTYKCCRAEPAD